MTLGAAAGKSQKMQISANHLLSLINDVLQMSKLEEGKTVLTHERISLVELTRDIITIIIGRAEEAGIEWEYEKDKSIIPYPYIYGSPLHLRQIFLNIYSNCIKYNRPGGKITTHTDSLGEQNGKCTYRWTISDTGIGMSPDFVDHIFEPFTQEKQDARSYYHGTGLGMTITKELVDLMGGSIAVTSQLGVGSTFVITLPFEIAPSPEQTPDACRAGYQHCRLQAAARRGQCAQRRNRTDPADRRGSNRNRRHGRQTGCGNRAEQSAGHIRRGSHGCDDACDERH